MPPWDADGTTAKREAEEQSESDDGDWVRRNGTEGTTWAGKAEATERGEDWVASPKISGDSWICGVDGTLRVMALLAGDGVEGMGVLRGTFILPQLISTRLVSFINHFTVLVYTFRISIYLPNTDR